MSRCGCNTNTNRNSNYTFFNSNIEEITATTGMFQANGGVCNMCNTSTYSLSPLEQAGFCPPLGEPQTLTLMAPAVFDESGLNLCRVIDFDKFANACDGGIEGRTTDILFDGMTIKDLEKATNLQVQVVDIDFNFVCPKSDRYSDIRPAKGNPNLSRVTLRDIDVTFAVKIIDPSCRVCKEGMMTLRYLPGEYCPGYDEKTNPSNVTFDLYTPYGLSFAAENPSGCNKLVPTINYIGYIAGDICQGNVACNDSNVPYSYKTFEPNNGLAQGISAQALAKVISADDDYLAIGLTLYFKVVYFVQYKFSHEGLCIPPKFTNVGGLSENSGCLAFVEGDLLEQSILPLSVCVEPKTI